MLTYIFIGVQSSSIPIAQMLKKKGNYKKTVSKFAYFKDFFYLCPRLRIG